eukprot:m.7098 g.7098  ORF g.7098 m.7098 type:complete len:492 (+) comp3647_c0_seq1:90-1565(+)
MQSLRWPLVVLVVVVGISTASTIIPSDSVPATPSKAHLLFHEDTVGAICHFNMQTMVASNKRSCPNTFAQSTFDPEQLDTDQWVSTAKSFGAKYFVLVVDHFSGFSVWPTSVHNYSVAASSWRGGKGDVVADFLASCNKYGMRPAFYYSVHENWYKNVCSFNLSNPTLQQEFEDMAMTQLQELATRFGNDTAEIWFDAGVRQSNAFVERVNNFVSTKLPETATCHSCQNMPDVNAVSWMGNEETVMPYPMWNTNDAQCSYNGAGKSYGIPGGSRWCPAHCDAVLRRHFWFWAPGSYNQTNNLNTPSELARMHITSVGRGCNMILDMSPQPNGLLQDNDVAAYNGMGAIVSALYNKSIASVDDIARGEHVVYATLATPTNISRGAIALRENMTFGQFVSAYTIQTCATSDSNEACSGGWSNLTVKNGGMETIGNHRIQHFLDAGVVAKVQVTVSTLTFSNGTSTLPYLRSVNLYDWSSSSYDDMVVDIFTVK